jgi:hypothetical protein
MPDFSGIYTKSVNERFIFLQIDQRFTGEIVASLQAFETSLLMISLGRWTNALISIANAIEILTREFETEEHEFFKLIDLFCIKFSVSDALRDAAHRSRRKRNEFTHNAIIPDDNDEAIRAYMNDALSVFKVFLAKSHKIDLYDAIWIERLRSNLIFTKNDIKNLPVETENIGFHLAILVKTIANNIHEKLTPEAMFSLPDEFNSREAFDAIKANQARFEEEHSSQFYHYAVPCPSDCGSFLSVAIDESKDDPEFAKNPFGIARCPNCGVTILPKKHIQKFVVDQLGLEKIKEFTDTIH